MTLPRASMRVISAGAFFSPGVRLLGEAGGAGVVGAQLGRAHDEVALHGAHVALEHGLLAAVVDVEAPGFDVDRRRRIGLEDARRALRRLWRLRAASCFTFSLAVCALFSSPR